jgi:hypothetical protein
VRYNVEETNNKYLHFPLDCYKCDEVYSIKVNNRMVSRIITTKEKINAICCILFRIRRINEIWRIHRR